MDVNTAWLEHRHYVLDLAFRMLGDLAAAEDAVQEAYIRLLRADIDEIDDVRGWLVVVVGRICLDQLRSARVRHEDRTAAVDETNPIELDDPADRVTLDESIRVALFVVLEQLTPAERAVFVLHDVFGFAFDTVASIVGRTPAACRQLASRARRRVAERNEPARFSVDPAEERRVTDRFIAACSGGDLGALMEVLDPDVVGTLDGQVRFAGREAVGTNALRFLGPDAERRLVSFPMGALVFEGGELTTLLIMQVESGSIRHIDAVIDRARLGVLARIVTR